MFCGEWSIVKTVDHVIRTASLPCRSWGCPECAEQRKKQLAALAMAGRATKFLTFTVDPAKCHTRDDGARRLRKAWAQLRRVLEERHGYARIQFLAVYEQHESGWPHLHVLARCEYIDQAWLSAFMADHGAGPICDIRDCSSRRALANYVTKYVAKEPERFAGCKRYWTSRDWEDRDRRERLREERRRNPWRVTKRDISWVMTTFKIMGFDVWWEEGELCARKPP